AVIEGVMIRGRRTVALACRKPNGDIYRYREPLRSPLVRSRLARLPFVRGVVVLWESLDYGIRMLMRSAEVQLDQEEQLGKGGNTLVMGVALAGALLLVIGVPYLATSLARALICSSTSWCVFCWSFRSRRSRTRRCALVRHMSGRRSCVCSSRPASCCRGSRPGGPTTG